MADDRDGRKPYRTYKAGRARRTALDDELAGARPARERPPQAGRSRETARRDGKGYERYGAGRKTAARPKPSRRRRFRWWHVPLGLLLALAVAGVVLTVLAWPGYKKFDRAVDKANKRVTATTRAQLTPDSGWIIRKPTTILLLGTDSKSGEPARSDTIMLMRFIPGSHKINQLSIPRDTRVVLPGRGYDKINEAMYWGGPSLAIKTIRQFLGIDIDHIMIVNFQGFPRLVNAVGGVDLYVPKTISTIAGSEHRVVTFTKGMHHFDGKYAMLYVRIRKVDDDFHRAARQQQFVQALEKKIVRPSSITKLPEIGKRFMSGVATDLTTNQILELAYLKWRSKGGNRQVLVGTPAYIGGVSYVLPPSEAEQQKAVKRFLGE